jgi:hypothetical protein
MYLIYEGPHLEVEVPHDLVAGGLIYAERGKPVDVPEEIADSLLSQGEENVEQIPVDPETGQPTRDPQHSRTWRKATATEIKAVERAAAKAAESADVTDGGEKAGESS